MVEDSVVVEDGVVVEDSLVIKDRVVVEDRVVIREDPQDPGKQSIRKIVSKKWMTFVHFVNLGLIY